MKKLIAIALLVFCSHGNAAPLEYGFSEQLESQVMGKAHQYYVSLPESYEQNKGAIFPVLYVMHGQWDMLSTRATLELLGEDAPSMIIVGVQGIGPDLHINEDGTQSKLSAFLHSELVPYIESSYRTAPFSILSGHSNSGRFVFNDWIRDGQQFSAYYSISPSLNDGEIHAALSKEASEQSGNGLVAEPKKKAPLIVTMSSEDQNMQDLFKQLEALLPVDKFGYPMRKSFPDETHSSTRHASMAYALRQSFPNWNPTGRVKRDFKLLKNHYEGLSERVGFAVDIPIDLLKRIAAFGSASSNLENNKDAVLAIKYSLKKEPKNADAFVGAADEIAALGSEVARQRIIKELCVHVPKHARCL